MTPDEIRDECPDIAGRWAWCGFAAREDSLNRLDQFSSELWDGGAHSKLRREINVLQQRLTFLRLFEVDAVAGNENATTGK